MAKPASAAAAQIPVPAHLAPYVEVLGPVRAADLFLALGGSQIYLPRRSSKRTLAAKTIGAEQVERLAAALGYGYIKVPLARQWVAQVLSADGRSDNEIARMVRADVATVRRWLGPGSNAKQLALPL
jgi:hypothetical protein